MKRHGVDYQGKFSNHDNEELKAAMSNTKVNHPNAGEVMIQGHFQSQEIFVQRKQLRDYLKEIDPDGTLACQRLRIKR